MSAFWNPLLRESDTPMMRSSRAAASAIRRQVPSVLPRIITLPKNGEGTTRIVLLENGNTETLLPKLEQLTRRGVAVVACSQCLYETSDFSLYEVGQRLLDCGVIPARDMTTEAAVTKLMWALGQTNDPQRVREIIDTDYAGEGTLPG